MSWFVEPVLVFTIARSKSSWVTATVIEELGAWTGTCGSGHRGYPKGQLENRHLCALQREWFGRGWQEADAGREIWPKRGFRDAVIETIHRNGYRGGPWVYKLSAWYWRAFLNAFPKATLITVRRDMQGIWDSTKRHGGNIASRRVIEAHFEAMDILRDEYGAFEINPSKEGVEPLRAWLRSLAF